MEKQLVPQLRFPYYDDNWNKVVLENITTKISDGIHTTPNYDLNGDYYFVNGNNLIDGVISINENTKKVTLEEFIKHKRPLSENSILLSINGTIGNLALYKNENIVLGKSACYINFKKGLPVDFYYYILQTPRIKKYFLSELTGSTIMNLSLKTVKGTKLIVPSIPEQQKIAAFLTAIDAKITQLTKKAALLEQYKKGIMQKIFSQELRFKPDRPLGGDDNGNKFPKWKMKKLGELLDYEQPTKYIVESTEYDDSFKTPVLTAGKSFLLGYTNETEGVYNKLPTIIFDDFTMANKYVDFEFKVKSSAMKILQPKTDEVNIKYVYEAIQMINYPKGDEHKRFWISEYSKIKIGYPCEEEQTKIANFLSDMDIKIEVLNTKIENSKVFKKGLLQKMFV